MNSTLRPTTNLVLCGLWAAILTSGLLFLSPKPIRIVVVTLVIGVIAGILQTRALREHESKFRSSESMLDVRSALMQSRYGKTSIWLLWLTGAALLVWCFRVSNLLSWFVGYASFAFGRDLTTLPTVFIFARPRVKS